MTDPVALTADLIRCPSVTPEEAGALTLLAGHLEAAGFTCRRIDRAGTPNLYARWGDTAPVLGFAGHTDVVPPGDRSAWHVDPFGGEIRDGTLWGRGAVDMKSGVAAFCSAAMAFAASAPTSGSLALLITGDEEGPARDGTAAILDWMASTGERMDACLVGEPTCPDRLGDVIKIGRRGSFTARITATGQQGHTAYPVLAANPLPVLVRFLDRLASVALDEGSAHFDPSTLALTTIDTGNPAGNVIPATARAQLNIRFGDAQTAEGLGAWLEREAAEASAGTGVTLDIQSSCSGEAFVTAPGRFVSLIQAAVEVETGIVPRLSTSGGTSDARFIRHHCPVVEFGLVGKHMHAVDERVETAQIAQLAAIYSRIITGFFTQT